MCLLYLLSLLPSSFALSQQHKIPRIIGRIQDHSGIGKGNITADDSHGIQQLLAEEYYSSLSDMVFLFNTPDNITDFNCVFYNNCYRIIFMRLELTRYNLYITLHLDTY